MVYLYARFFDHRRETLQRLRPRGQGVSCIFNLSSTSGDFFFAIFWSYWSWIYTEFSKLSSSLSFLFFFCLVLCRWYLKDGVVWVHNIHFSCNLGTASRLLKQPNMDREQAALGSFQEILRGVQDPESRRMHFLNENSLCSS